MGMLYPCQVGLPRDLDPTIRGFIFLCCDFQIISQDHDGVSSAVELAEDRLAVWAALVHRGGYRFRMHVLQESGWNELRIHLAQGDSSDFLRIIFRQARRVKKRSCVTDLGWHFSGTPELEPLLREWVHEVWPDMYTPHLDVTALRHLIPQDERESATSETMSHHIHQLFGWFSQLRVAA